MPAFKVKQNRARVWRFDLEGYSEFLKCISGWAPVILFQDVYQAKKPFILLRHDIDICPSLCLFMAGIEAKQGILTTYHVLMSSNLYNAASVRNRSVIQDIASHGHEIGLHFDSSAYQDEAAAKKGFELEVKMLSEISGKAVQSFSFHNPSLNPMRLFRDGLINAYAPDLFSPETFLSDSRMDFRNKEPWTFIRSSLDQNGFVHISLHPEHYVAEEPSYSSLFFHWLKEQVDIMEQTMRVNSKFNADFGKKPTLEILWQEFQKRRITK